MSETDKPSPIDKLKARREKLDAQIKRAEKKRRDVERAQDTRRKIIIGALVMADAERSEERQAYLDRLLNKGVIRDIDRKLFDLPPKPKPQDKSGDSD